MGEADSLHNEMAVLVELTGDLVDHRGWGLALLDDAAIAEH